MITQIYSHLSRLFLRQIKWKTFVMLNLFFILAYFALQRRRYGRFEVEEVLSRDVSFQQPQAILLHFAPPAIPRIVVKGEHVRRNAHHRPCHFGRERAPITGIFLKQKVPVQPQPAPLEQGGLPDLPVLGVRDSLAFEHFIGAHTHIAQHGWPHQQLLHQVKGW
jgi:hypothetical protein